MRPLIALLICLLSWPACAESLYRCVGKTGQVSYQSATCPAGQRIDRTIDFVPDPESVPTKASETKRDRHASPKSRSIGRVGRASSPRKPRLSPCARAKAKRESQLNKLGLKRTFDDLSRIDAAVREVCKGY